MARQSRADLEREAEALRRENTLQAIALQDLAEDGWAGRSCARARECRGGERWELWLFRPTGPSGGVVMIISRCEGNERPGVRLAYLDDMGGEGSRCVIPAWAYAAVDELRQVRRAALEAEERTLGIPADLRGTAR